MLLIVATRCQACAQGRVELLSRQTMIPWKLIFRSPQACKRKPARIRFIRIAKKRSEDFEGPAANPRVIHGVTCLTRNARQW